MALLVHNASEVVTMKRGLGVLKHGSVLINEGRIQAIGRLKKYPRNVQVLDADGCTVLPGFVDSHTHLVFGGSRENEFDLRTQGASYAAIAKAGGGIASSVRMTRKTSEQELFKIGIERLARVIKHGTTTIEIKSGYGLAIQPELKTLRVIKRLRRKSAVDIIPTYLVHGVPKGTPRRTFIRQVIRDVIPKVVSEKLAVFCDVFCDTLAFSLKESESILQAARSHGLKLKLHADQFSNTNGARLAARMGCVSVDHLEYTPASVIRLLKKHNVVPTLLPGVTLFLRMKKKPDISAFTKHDLSTAIASDFNPGSCTIYAMPKIVSLACLLYDMSIADALAGATIHGARALGMENIIGSLEKGKQADIVICNVDNHKKIPYYFGEDMVVYTIKKGKIIYGKNC